MSGASNTNSIVTMSDIEKAEADIEKAETESAPDVDTTRAEPQQQPAPTPQIPDTRRTDEQISGAPPLVVWDDENDLENPHNWSLAMRSYHAMVPGLFGFAVTFGTSVYTPGVSEVMSAFSVSRTVALLGLSVYTFGLGFGPIISAPLSEQYGRKIIYMISAPIFMSFTVGAGFSNSLGSLIVCRFLAGCTGSPALAVGSGTIADLFPPRQRAVVSSLFLMAPFMGPSIGPIVGGFAAQYKSWRWTQWCMIFLSLAVFIAATPMKETYKPIILARRARKAGITVPKKVGPNGGIAKALARNFVKPLHMLAIEPVVLFMSMYTGFAFSVLFLFFAAFPFILSRPPYSFTISQTGLFFIGIGLGVLLAGLTSILADRHIYQAAHKRASAKGNAHARPEHRLYSAMLGSLGIPIGLFWFAWSANSGVHWIVLCIATVPFAWGNLCLFSSAALYLSDVYGPSNGASAMAANGFLRYSLGAVFPLFAVQMYQRLGIGWATSLLGFLSVAMLPIPWILFRWGPTIRKRSSYPVLM